MRTSTGLARGPATLRPAQANAGTGVRHHQIGDGLPPVLATRPGQGQGRMELGDPDLEHQRECSPCNTREQAAQLRVLAKGPKVYARLAIHASKRTYFVPSREGIRVYSPCGTRGQATALRVLTKGARSHDLSTSRSVHTHSRGPQSDRLLGGSNSISEDGASVSFGFSFLYAMKPDAPLPLARRNVYP